MRKFYWIMPAIFLALFILYIGFGFSQNNPNKGYVIYKADIPPSYQTQQQCSFVINVEHCHNTDISIFVPEQFRIDISTCTLQDVLHNWLKQNFWCAYNTFFVLKTTYTKAQLGQYIDLSGEV